MIKLRKHDAPERFWNMVSKRFSNAKRMMNSPALETVNQNADKYFSGTERVLDIGCGPGDITLVIAKKTKEVYASDISAGMIRAAEQKALNQKVSNIQFIQTDFSEKSFHPESFEVVTAFNVLQYITHKQHLYDRIFEYLKPQGLFISTTACLRERKSLLRFILSGLVRLKMVPAILFYKTSELEQEMIDAGFTIIESADIAKAPERFIVAKKE